MTRLEQSSKPGAHRAREIYSQFLVGEGDTHKANMAIFHKMGSSRESSFILKHHYREFGSLVEKFVKKHFFFILNTLNFSWIEFCHHYLFMLVKTTIYVVDIVKDVKFIVLLNSVILEKPESSLEGMLNVGLAAAIGFLILSEIIKMIQLYQWEGLSKKQRSLRVILSPFQLIPILIHHYERKLKLKMNLLCTISEPSADLEESLTQTRNELTSILRLKGEHRSTENVLEHFVQFILSLIVLVANNSETDELQIVDLSYSQFYFSIASSIISIMSMVRGQINLISSQENGQLGFLAKVLIAIYVTLALATRATIICFSIFATYQLKSKISFIHTAFILVIIAVTLFHILFSYLIQKRFLKETKSKLKQALWSFLSPPLYLDWEYIYRAGDCKMPIPECWQRTISCFVCHNVLTLVGNLAFGIPFHIFGSLRLGTIHFSSYSTATVIVVAIVSQYLLLVLGFFYFSSIHPWARILKTELIISYQNRFNRMRPRSNSIHVPPLKVEMHKNLNPPGLIKLRRNSL